MPSYIIRAIDPRTWELVKARAAKDGHKLRWVILRLIELYAEYGLPDQQPQPQQQPEPEAPPRSSPLKALQQFVATLPDRK